MKGPRWQSCPLQRAASVWKAEALPAWAVRVGALPAVTRAPYPAPHRWHPVTLSRFRVVPPRDPGAWPWGQPRVGAWGHQRQVSPGFTF